MAKIMQADIGCSDCITDPDEERGDVVWPEGGLGINKGGDNECIWSKLAPCFGDPLDDLSTVSRE